MPIVDGRYETKISMTFRSMKEAVEAIKDKIAKSRRVRISGIPMSLLKKLLPLLKGKDVKIILPLGEKADSMDYDKCVKCMRGMFEVGWRYSKK